MPGGNESTPKGDAFGKGSFPGEVGSAEKKILFVRSHYLQRFSGALDDSGVLARAKRAQRSTMGNR